MRTEQRSPMAHYIIFTGTDPNSMAGGIGTVASGYLFAATGAGLENESIPTYAPTPFGKTILWLLRLPQLFRRIRAIKALNRLPIVYSHTGGGMSFFREFCVLAIGRLAGARVVMHIHAPQVDNYLNSPFNTTLLKMAFLSTHRLVVLTPWWKMRLQTAGVRDQIHIIPNPLPVDLQKMAEQSGRSVRVRPDNAVRLLTMCRLVPGKGVDVALQALAALPAQVTLDIAGDGPETEQLKRLADRLGLDGRARFHGWVTGEKKRELLEQADIFCLPSTNDVYPMSMVEAMANGIPVVGVKYAGIPDMVADGLVGILVESPDPALIAEALTSLLEPTTRERMGREAKTWVQKVSSPQTVGKALKELVESL